MVLFYNITRSEVMSKGELQLDPIVCLCKLLEKPTAQHYLQYHAGHKDIGIKPLYSMYCLLYILVQGCSNFFSWTAKMGMFSGT